MDPLGRLSVTSHFSPPVQPTVGLATFPPLLASGAGAGFLDDEVFFGAIADWVEWKVGVSVGVGRGNHQHWLG